MLFYLARAAGFANDPQELLTSHYLVEYDFENIFKDTFDQHITGSWIARSFTLRPSWSKVLGGTTLPTFIPGIIRLQASAFGKHSNGIVV